MDFFRRVIEHTGCGVLRYGLDDGRVKYANPGLARILGADLSPEDLLDKPLRDFIMPLDSEAVARSGLLERGAVSDWEYGFRTRDGEERWVLLDAVTDTHEATGERVAEVLAVDITQRKLREAKQEQTERRMRILLDAIPDTMFLLRDGLFVDYSFNSRMLFVPPEQFVGKRLDAVLPPEVGVEGMRLLEQAQATGKPQLQEYDLVIADEQRSFEARIAPAGGTDVLVMVREITEAKRAQRALSAEKQRLSVTLTSIGDAVIATDAAGMITLMNPVAERMTGWAASEAIGLSLGRVFRILNETTRKPMEDPVGRVLETGGTVGLANGTLLIAKDGSERVIADSGAPIRSDAGDLTGVVLVFRDLTEEKRLQDERIRSQKLESLALLAGGIAHDFNNILTAAVGNVSLARMHVNQEDAAGQRLGDAEKALSRARELTNQLLTFAKGGPQARAVTAVGPLVREAVNLGLSGSTVQAELIIPPDLWKIRVDKGQISQVVENLIINADQAMPGGGHVHVVLENVEVEEGWQHPLQPGRYVRLTVHDTGMGIPRAHMSRIFEPYFTTKQKGSGLGLAISYSIISNHQGGMFVDSELGSGTTFWVYVPASESDVVDVAAPRPQPVRGSGRLLVMDDDELVRGALKAMLADLGYEAVFARDGSAAITEFQTARDMGSPFDVAILDLTVRGGMGGRDCMRNLKTIDPSVKALVISGYADDPAILDHGHWGFAGAIRKPFRLDELSAALRRVMSAT